MNPLELLQRAFLEAVQKLKGANKLPNTLRLNSYEENKVYCLEREKA